MTLAPRIVVPALAAIAIVAAPGPAAAAAPATIPAVRDWQPHSGPGFRLGERSRIVIGRGPRPLRTTARVLAHDLELRSGRRPEIVAAGGRAMRAGDIRINQNPGRAGDVGRQGYKLGIGRVARIKGGEGTAPSTARGRCCSCSPAAARSSPA